MNESLDSRQLKAFVVLARTGSYTETAKQLYLTHSAISHSMRALESQVGCRLLSKLSKKVILTEAGEALLHHAVRALDEMRRARTTLAELNKWGSRRLRLAVAPIFLSTVLAPVLLKFHGEFPDLLLQVESSGGSDPEWLLENNRADVVLAEKPAAGTAVEFAPILADRYQLIVNATHPLAAKKNVSHKEFGRHPCFLLRTSTQGRKQMETFLSQRDLAFSTLGEIESVEVIKNFVKHTPAMSFLPGWIVGAELKTGLLSSLSIGRAPFEQTWGLVYSCDRPLNHVESTLLKLCRKHVEELG